MKVCLINPTNQNKNWGHSFPPLGLAYVAAQLKKNNIDVFIFDRDLLLEKNNLNLAEVDRLTKEMLIKEKPDFIGITATTAIIYDAYSVAKIAKELLPCVKVIVGGVHATVLPQKTMAECSAIDYLVVGDGELTFCELVKKEEPQSILGILYRTNKGVISNPPQILIKDIDSISRPARELLDMATYTRRSKHLIRGVSLRGTSIFTTRGCPYQCSFCCAPLVFGRGIRFHSVDYVVSEIEELLDKYGVEGIYFADDMFASRKDRAVAICDEIIKRGLNKKFVFAVQLKVTAVDKEFLLKLKQAGCIQVEYGFESGSQKILDLMNKGVKVEDNYKAARLTKKLGLRVLANLMTGLPLETKEDFLKTINFIDEIKPDITGLYKLILLPGTQLFDLYAKQYSKADDWNRALVDDLTTNFTSMANDDFFALFKQTTFKIAIRNAYCYFFYNLKRDCLGTIFETMILVLNKIKKLFIRPKINNGS